LRGPAPGCGPGGLPGNDPGGRRAPGPSRRRRALLSYRHPARKVKFFSRRGGRSSHFVEVNCRGSGNVLGQFPGRHRRGSGGLPASWRRSPGGGRGVARSGDPAGGRVPRPREGRGQGRTGLDQALADPAQNQVRGRSGLRILETSLAGGLRAFGGGPVRGSSGTGACRGGLPVSFELSSLDRNRANYR
jgi:hypothetical protein